MKSTINNINNIKVVCRFRPQNKKEIGLGEINKIQKTKTELTI